MKEESLKGIRRFTDSSDSSSDETILMVGKHKSDQKIDADIAGMSVNMLINSGQASVIKCDRRKYLSHQLVQQDITFKKYDFCLFTYEVSSPFRVKGTFSAKLKANKQKTTAQFVSWRKKGIMFTTGLPQPILNRYIG